MVADITLVAGKSTQQVAYTGKIKGERAMIDLEDIGNEVEHRYAVSYFNVDSIFAAIHLNRDHNGLLRLQLHKQLIFLWT